MARSQQLPSEERTTFGILGFKFQGQNPALALYMCHISSTANQVDCNGADIVARVSNLLWAHKHLIGIRLVQSNLKTQIPFDSIRMVTWLIATEPRSWRLARSFCFQAKREQLKKKITATRTYKHILEIMCETWFKPGPESGLDCLMCAIFTRQQTRAIFA